MNLYEVRVDRIGAWDLVDSCIVLANSVEEATRLAAANAARFPNSAAEAGVEMHYWLANALVDLIPEGVEPRVIHTSIINS